MSMNNCVSNSKIMSMGMSECKSEQNYEYYCVSRCTHAFDCESEWESDYEYE